MKHIYLISLLLILPACVSSSSQNETRIEVGQAFQGGQIDKTIDLIINPPAGFTENQDKARKYGVHAIYEQEGLPKNDTQGFSIVFVKGRFSRNLESYVASDIQGLQGRVPDLQLTEIGLPTDLQNKFDELGFPVVGVLCENPEPRGNPNRISDSMAFYFQTNGGYWTVTRYAPASTLRADLKTTTAFLRGMEISLR